MGRSGKGKGQMLCFVRFALAGKDVNEQVPSLV